MSSTFRFPLVVSGNAGVEELDQIITLQGPVNTLPQGGPAVYADVTPWRQVQYDTEMSYCSIVIEFLAAAAPVIIGDGTSELIGLYGEILTGPGAGRFLLGRLGMTLVDPLPQIPLFSATVGFAQVVQLAGVYDRLAVGGILGAIAPAPEPGLTIRARPIRERSFIG